jgi:hypothetical protein
VWVERTSNKKTADFELVAMLWLLQRLEGVSRRMGSDEPSRRPTEIMARRTVVQPQQTKQLQPGAHVGSLLATYSHQMKLHTPTQ